MKYTSICPGCNKDVSRIRVIDLVYIFKESDDDNLLIQIPWHRKCYPPAPALLAVLEMVQKRLQEKPGGVVAFTGEEWTQIDAAIAEAKGSDD